MKSCLGGSSRSSSYPLLKEDDILLDVRLKCDLKARTKYQTEGLILLKGISSEVLYVQKVMFNICYIEELN